MTRKTSDVVENQSLNCPVGKADCPLIQELIEIRRKLADLSEQACTDPLTGLSNYRYFAQSLEQEMVRTQRSGLPTTLIMLDIDYFKQVNDSWGHEVGNRALSHISGLIQQTVRRLDISCRYGGEEFAIILPNTDLAASVPVAERLRKTIAETPLPIGEKQLQLTASLGVGTYQSGDQVSLAELVQRADHYLYLAKQEGRNQVRHAELPQVDLVSRAEKDALFNLFGNDRSGTEKKPKSDAD